MIKKIVVPLILVLAVASAAYVLSSTKRPAPTNTPLPSTFASIKAGMTEGQVVSLVGQPVLKSRYAKYEKKTPAYWTTLQNEVNANSSASAYGNAPSLKFIRARMELTHRYKDVWLYKPKPNVLMTLYFGDDGILLNSGLTAVDTTNRSNGPGTTMQAPPASGA